MLQKAERKAKDMLAKYEKKCIDMKVNVQYCRKIPLGFINIISKCKLFIPITDF